MIFVALTIVFAFAFAYLSVVFFYFRSLCAPDDNASFHLDWELSVSGCYFLNAETAKDRRSYMETMLERLQIDARRVELIRGYEIAHQYPHLTISHRELGINASHLAALTLAKRRGWTVILEDNIYPSLSFSKNTLLRALDSLPVAADTVHLAIPPWRMLLYLLTFRFQRCSQQVWTTTSPMTCAFGYVVRHDGIARRRRQIESTMESVPVEHRHYDDAGVHLLHRIDRLSDFFRVLMLDDFSMIQCAGEAPRF